jgi:hypothetical protein
MDTFRKSVIQQDSRTQHIHMCDFCYFDSFAPFKLCASVFLARTSSGTSSWRYTQPAPTLGNPRAKQSKERSVAHFKSKLCVCVNVCALEYDSPFQCSVDPHLQEFNQLTSQRQAALKRIASHRIASHIPCKGTQFTKHHDISL